MKVIKVVINKLNESVKKSANGLFTDSVIKSV